MKILSIKLKNFGSYRELDFDLRNQGLTLIQGATGSGKSTLCDAIPWILFGRTAKGGAVDEVRSWGSLETTYGKMTVEIRGKIYSIYRHRGTTANNNDLYYYGNTYQQAANRGKDLPDTQRLLSKLIGCDYDMYMAGSYYHEFSETAQFFTTTAKNRRSITEQLADLSLPIRLRDSVSTLKKTHLLSHQELLNKIKELQSNVELLKRLQVAENNKSALWEKSHRASKEYTVKLYENFEKDRDKVISNQCSQCRTVLAEPTHIHNDSPNPYIHRLAELEKESNPHTDATKDYTLEIQSKLQESQYLENEISGLNISLSDLDTLSDVLDTLRSLTIKNTITFIQDNTNNLLSDFFDGELRVAFDVASNDKLEVLIQKDGNNCTFTQLSKGQRCLLKLCFGVAVMTQVQNHNGLDFNCLVFDESLDGLDDNFKVKAYRLFESLSKNYESILLVEHNEALKSMFENKFSVELLNGESHIAKT